MGAGQSNKSNAGVICNTSLNIGRSVRTRRTNIRQHGNQVVCNCQCNKPSYRPPRARRWV